MRGLGQRSPALRFPPHWQTKGELSFYYFIKTGMHSSNTAQKNAEMEIMKLNINL